ncbi:hypothetical protein AGMMS50212_06590 [Spirochaetia bacterium]|nr:hypothetical protein AGMMS50212_06590 [Spirochaetia bacterium]
MDIAVLLRSMGKVVFMKLKLFFVFFTFGFSALLFGVDPSDFKTSVQTMGMERSVIITGYTGLSKDVVIPVKMNGFPVRVIGENAFRQKGLTSVTIPEGVEVISRYAFYGNNLGQIILPVSVKIVDSSAFDSNSIVRVLTTKEANAPITKYYSQTPPQNYAPVRTEVYQTTNSRSSPDYGGRIPGTLVAPLTGVPLSDAVARNDRYAPLNGEEPRGYSSKAVDRPTSTETVYTKTNPAYIESATPVQLPPTNTNAARWVTNPMVKLPKVVSAADKFALAYDSNGRIVIAEFIADSMDSSVAIPPGFSNGTPTGIGKQAFKAKAIKSIVIPSTITYIGESAFMSNNLTDIVIPDSVRFIDKQAFDGNDLTTITIGGNVILQPDSFGYRFFDYYNMAGKIGGTYIFKAGQWDLYGIERVNYNVKPYYYK